MKSENLEPTLDLLVAVARRYEAKAAGQTPYHYECAGMAVGISHAVRVIAEACAVPIGPVLDREDITVPI